jgi:D-ribose pyranase
MLNKGILNPNMNSLLARVRHNNSLLITDRGFTNFPGVEIIDISLVDDIPTVLQVFNAIQPNFDISQIVMAKEFQLENTDAVQAMYKNAFGNIPVTFEPYVQMKKRVPDAIGFIRTGDTIQYANMLLISGRID